MAIDPSKLPEDVEKAFNDALVGSNAEVQKRGPGVVGVIKRFWFIPVGLIAVLVFLAAVGVRL